MRDVAPVGGFAGSPGAVVSMMMGGGPTHVFVRAGRAPVMVGVTGMNGVAIVGGMTVRRRGRGGVMPMRAGRSAASGGAVVAVMR